MMFHFRPIFSLPDSQLQTTDMSNWPKVSVVHLNHLFVYTSLLSLRLLQTQQQCGVRGSNCKRWEGQGSLRGTWVAQRWLQSLQFEVLSAWKESWPWQDRSLSLPCGKKQEEQRVSPCAHSALLKPNGKLSLQNTPRPQRDVSGDWGKTRPLLGWTVIAIGGGFEFDSNSTVVYVLQANRSRLILYFSFFPSFKKEKKRCKENAWSGALLLFTLCCIFLQVMSSIMKPKLHWTRPIGGNTAFILLDLHVFGIIFTVISLRSQCN